MSPPEVPPRRDPAPLVAVLDVGKTNSKVVVADPDTGEEVWSATRANGPAAGAPYRAIDAWGIERFLLGALAEARQKAEIGAIVPVAHGACAALVAGDGLALPVLDYEDPALEGCAEAYRPERDPFADTLSPFLPLGLNLGRQLFFLETRHPREFAAAEAILPWPQYWAWRLTGVAASEVTSLGCHTDLWLPREGRFSRLAERRGWAAKVPPLRVAGDTLGGLRPEVARATGLDPGTRVLAGIHDSNASFLRHRAGRPAGEPFAVVSSGTWVVVLASGVPLDRLDEGRDCLANVDAYGEPVATARFMGGREYAAVASEPAPPPTPAGLARVLDRGAMALPGFAEAGGPFQGAKGCLADADGMAGEALSALATLYVALVADVSLDLLRAREGSVVVEGPLAENPLFGPVLAALRPGQPVVTSGDRAGTVGGALILAAPPDRAPPARLTPVAPLDEARLASHRRLWRELAGVAAVTPRD